MDEPTDLNDTQRARADALVIAGRLLGKTGGLTAQALPEHRSVTELVDLADYILSGKNPLEDWRDRNNESLPTVYGEGNLAANPTWGVQGVVSTPGDDPVGDGRPGDQTDD